MKIHKINKINKVNKNEKSSLLRDKLKDRIQLKSTLSLHSVINFGQFKGRTIREIIEQDPRYVNWLIEEKKMFLLDNEAYIFYLREYEDLISSMVFIDKSEPTDQLPWE